MAKIYKSITELVGNTPLIELAKYSQLQGLKTNILAKLEYFNPTHSVKDRIAKAMIEDAEEKGLITSGDTIIEPTSGNTGIGLASIGVAKGYKVILTMPETMSVERTKLLKAYGATVVLTSGTLGMSGAIREAEKLHRSIKNSIILGQFTNIANPITHRETTGKEVWKDTDGSVDIFVSGIGTGGTITGVGEYLKSKNPNIKVVAVEPKGSPVLSQGRSGKHRIQGIGAGFVPSVLNTDIYDEVIAVADESAIKTAKLLVQHDGLLVGISSGAVVWASTELAKRPENSGKNIVALLPDTGERYLSMRLF